MPHHEPRRRSGLQEAREGDQAEPAGPGVARRSRDGHGEDSDPGQPIAELVSTSYVDATNPTIRMGNRRFTQLTNAHSKKFENHVASIALYFAHYNLVRRHSTLRCTPAMAAGVTSTMWSMDEMVDAALAHGAKS